jgi:hypothetical protein
MRKIILPGVILFFAVMALTSFKVLPFGNGPQDKPATVAPADVQKILENSCYDCHSDLSTNPKSLDKLNFSKWNTYTDVKKVAKYSDMSDEVSKGDMPPGKYLEKYPEKALTADQKKAVVDWANQASNKLMGN